MANDNHQSDSDPDASHAPTDLDQDAGSSLSEKIGPYRLLERIGEGGMGEVYLAEQQRPVRRQVALKLIKLGMDTRAVVARFETERQALAVMDHPGIAKVFDAGAADNGRPYFVMELVRGVPLTQYCDARKVGTQERVRLFIGVCQAVQHAHQKGVLHRDLKPTNILVTEVDGKPVPKVIDFGLAKATGQSLTDKTLVTLHGLAMGTPAYMSPEQAEMSGLDVDTRTDIYSLGVTLYELLVGCLPIDPGEVGAHAFVLQLAQGGSDPPAPSAKLATLGESRTSIARARATDPAGLRRAIEGDLDWIVMKAVETDRARRYESASDMSRDLQRYLDHEPVSARPPTAAYRIRKFVRRHTAAVGVATAAAVMVLAFAIVMAVQAGMIAQERDNARQETDKARAVNDFMTATLLAPDPIEGLGREVTVVEALGAAVDKLEGAFVGQPEVEASARNAIGWAYFQLGRYDEAESLLEQALSIRRETPGPPHEDLAESLVRWGRLQAVRSRFQAAEDLYLEALAMRRSLPEVNDADVAATLRTLGSLQGELGRYDEAETTLREALALLAAAASATESLAASPEVADLENQLGVLLWNQGKYEELEPLWQRVLVMRRRDLGERHPLVAEAMNNLAVLFDSTGRPEQAERHYRDALDIMIETLGSDHEEVGAAMANLAILLDDTGRPEEAERLYREGLRIDRAQLGNDSPAVAIDLVNLASLLCENERADEALPMINEALATFEATLEPGHWRIGNTVHWRGSCLGRLGRSAEAERDLLSGLAILTEALGPDHARVERVRVRLAELYDAWGKPGPASIR